MVGRTLGHYEIIEPLGAGGMGEVYRARDTTLKREVALKVLPQEVTSSQERLERFQREAEALAALDHPNIVTIHTVEEAGGVRFLTMQLVEGEQLSEVIPEGGMPLARIFDIAIPLADALTTAHDQGIVHRDLKPANIMVSDDGRVRVLDFGLAKLREQAAGVAGQSELPTVGEAAPLTEEGRILGTMPYMSPEQLEGKDVDSRSDIFSLGAVVYEMATGERPFRGDTPVSLISSIVKDEPRSVDAVRADLPHHLGRIVRRCLEKDRERRFQRVKEIRNELEDLRTEAISGTLDEPSPMIAPPRRTLRRVARVAGLAALAVLIAVAGLYLYRGWVSRLGSGDIAGPRIESLVVLPFDNLSGDPEQEYFVDGMTGELTAELARIGALHKVISRTSAMQYKEHEKSIPEIARELNVDAVVEGTVLRAGDQVRITVQLIEGLEDRNIWGESYERNLQDVLALQSEVAGAVARQIEVALGLAEQERIELPAQPGSAHQPDPEAYDAYLKARYHLARWGDEAQKTAIRYYEEAIARDPTFARAYADLAQVLVSPPVLDFERGGVAARTALDLDPALPEAHVALGVMRMLEWDWMGSEAAFQRAIELKPSSWEAHGQYASLLRMTMRLDEALSEARRAAELDPFSLLLKSNVGSVLFWQHHYDEAIEVWDAVLELEPEFGSAIYSQGTVYAMQGRGEEVISAARRAEAARLSSAEPMVTWLLGIGHALSGQRDDAEEILRDLEAHYATSYPGPIAALHLFLGDEDEALDWLEKAYELRLPWLPNFTSLPWFDDLRDHPRFRELRAQMGLQ